MPRLFVALQLEAQKGRLLTHTVARLVDQLGGHAVPSENLHATLCFIGEVEPGRLDALRGAVGGVRGECIRLDFDALEYWDTPKILCATATRDVPAARELSVALGEVLIAAGFAPDIKPFRAHLTLARKISAARAATAHLPLPLEPAVELFADSFVLMSSRRDGERSIYSVENSWPLYARESQCFEQK